jgi:hydroxymethylpyrimidine/phosphomethylpyrimidine kinase
MTMNSHDHQPVPTPKPRPRICVTIGTSDSSGGAGIQGDIKAFAATGCWGATVVAGLTAQNSLGVQGRLPVPPRFVEMQWRSIDADHDVQAVKVGVTWDSEMVAAVAALLGNTRVPIVVDPVMVAASGAALSDNDNTVRDAVVREYLPLASVITPNLREARLLTGDSCGAPDVLAKRLLQLGARAALVTTGGIHPVDYFAQDDTVVEIAREDDPGRQVHGAGCAQSSLTAAFLAHGHAVSDAVRLACELASRGAVNAPAGIGTGIAPIDVLGIADRSMAMGRA